MKKSNLFTIIYFAVLLLAASLVSCSSSQHGYDYKAHSKRNGHGPVNVTRNTIIGNEKEN